MLESTPPDVSLVIPSITTSIMKLGNDDVPGIEWMREHGHRFIIQCDANGPGRTWLKTPSPLRCPWYPVVNPVRHFAVDQESVAAMPEIASGPCENDDTARSLFAFIERPQTEVDEGTRPWKRGPVNMSDRVAAG